MTQANNQAIALRKPLCDSEKFFKTIGAWEDLPGPSRMVMTPNLVELTWNGLDSEDGNDNRRVILRADLESQQVEVAVQLFVANDREMCRDLHSITESLRSLRWEALVRNELCAWLN